MIFTVKIIRIMLEQTLAQKKGKLNFKNSFLNIPKSVVKLNILL